MSAIPQEARRLLSERIETFEELEALLLVMRHPDQKWLPSVIAAKLRIAEDVAARTLDRLVQRDLLSSLVGGAEPAYAYKPKTPELSAAVGELDEVYRSNPVDVVKFLSEQAILRVRGSATRAFADAFVLGKGKKDG